MLKHTGIVVLAVLLLGSCDKDSGEGNNTPSPCGDEAPLATLQAGVCAGMVQVCAELPADGGFAWVEPDYSRVEGFEDPEFSCDGRDNDCDGGTDQGLLFTFFADVDEDGLGDPATAVEDCTAPANHVTNSLDCDDTNPEIRTSCRSFCRLLDPTQQHIPLGESSGVLSVAVFADGVTTGTGDATDLIVELGVGPIFTFPQQPTWSWSPATFAADEPDHDLYQAQWTPMEAGVFHFAFRFTVDGGQTYMYCDRLGNETYDPRAAGGFLVDPPCQPGLTQCLDCLDNDDDGFIDGWDPECIKPTDDDEAAFSTGTVSDDNGRQKLDCWYDGDAGAGNDSCETHVCCLLDEPCEDFPVELELTKFWPYDCSAPLDPSCVDSCLPSTPPGCDCFGCCTVCVGTECHDILIGTPGNFAQCSQGTYQDPALCPRCTLHPECSRPCNPGDCELCPGMTPLDLPPHCTETTCPGDLQTCLSTTECPANHNCQFGCCIQDFIVAK
ncbi:MAG: hypothetical protein CVU65_06105 [Deltaproteobacteria bacterium HGW-Deltaproteobacteria-22]|nr:MAG: hypothetical protein CVU65_06105 [Deltaproteobacteria bacterium HGW-Deltaproteobacteria-22]